MRRERPDRLMILGARQLYRVIQENMGYSNQARPHQGLEQSIPEGSQVEGAKPGTEESIAFPVLGGLPHDYRRAG